MQLRLHPQTHTHTHTIEAIVSRMHLAELRHVFDWVATGRGGANAGLTGDAGRLQSARGQNQKSLQNDSTKTVHLRMPFKSLEYVLIDNRLKVYLGKRCLYFNHMMALFFDILFHELQSQVGGFLCDSLYLLHSSAVIGVPTVSVHSCELHALRLGDGQSQPERLRFRVQDAS